MRLADDYGKQYLPYEVQRERICLQLCTLDDSLDELEYDQGDSFGWSSDQIRAELLNKYQILKEEWRRIAEKDLKVLCRIISNSRAEFTQIFCFEMANARVRRQKIKMANRNKLRSLRNNEINRQETEGFPDFAPSLPFSSEAPKLTPHQIEQLQRERKTKYYASILKQQISNRGQGNSDSTPPRSA